MQKEASKAHWQAGSKGGGGQGMNSCRDPGPFGSDLLSDHLLTHG